MSQTAPFKRPKPNPLPLPRPKDTTRELVHKVDRSQYSPQIPRPKAPKGIPLAVIQALKLGKAPAKRDGRTLYMGELLDKRKLPPATPFDWDDKLPDDLGMMGNDVAGDCTCAGWGHLAQVQTSATGGSMPTMTTDQVLAMYKAITAKVNGRPFDPADPSTDTGLALLDVLNWLREQGLIGAFAKLHHNDREQIEIGGRLFGGLYTGAMLPVDAQRQIGQVWTPTRGDGGEVGSWGGHCMYASQSDDTGLTYITWAKRQRALYSWVAKYADEMYVVIDRDWVTGEKPAPSGFDLPALQKYLASL